MDLLQLPFFKKSYTLLAYRFCRRFDIIERIFSNDMRESMKPEMRRAALQMTVEEYFSAAIITSLLMIPIMLFVLMFATTALLGLPNAAALILSLLFSAVSGGAMFALFFIFPKYRTDAIRRNIESNLPYATAHMATIAGTGVPMYLVFKLIGNFPEYGEVSKESRRIARNIEVFGYDTLTALSESATQTPSPSFKDLLWGVVSVIRSGGDARRLLTEKAKEYMDRQKTIEAEYIDSLSIMAEMYITIFVAGPILFMIMMTIMGSMGNIGLPLDVIFSIFIYLLLPAMSVGFIFMLEGSKPVGVS